MTYEEFFNKKANDASVNIFPKGTSADEAVSILCEHFLGEDWYSTLPFNCHDQIITEIVADILSLYSNPKAMRKTYKLFEWLRFNKRRIK